MSNIDKQALRINAQLASSGKWIKESGDGWEAICSSDDQANAGFIVAHFEGPDAKENREFIQAASPATVLALLDELEAKDSRVAELQSENAYIRNRHKELDLLIGKNILVMQAAIIEWQGTGDARKGLAWIYNTLFGPGELPDESEKNAQAYFDRKYSPLNEELMALHRWFWEQSEAERAAADGKGE